MPDAESVAVKEVGGTVAVKHANREDDIWYHSQALESYEIEETLHSFGCCDGIFGVHVRFPK